VFSLLIRSSPCSPLFPYTTLFRSSAVQALIRWDPVTYARRELAERAELGFPPAVRMASVTGSAAAVRQFLRDTELPDGAEILGRSEERRVGKECRSRGAA